EAVADHGLRGGGCYRAPLVVAARVLAVLADDVLANRRAGPQAGDPLEVARGRFEGDLERVVVDRLQAEGLEGGVPAGVLRLPVVEGGGVRDAVVERRV